MTEIRKIAEKYKDSILADYKHIHAHPELSCQEKETTAYIAAKLQEMGLEPNLDYPEYGVTALIRGNVEGPTILLRADIDALPVTEVTGADYASENNGVMHACGHDSHTAGLLGAARILLDVKDELKGCVKLCFQPAEEVPNHGARLMVEAGVLENPKVDFSAGVHVSSRQKLGEVFTKAGNFSAYGDRWCVTVKGKGAHGSQPQLANDPVGAVLVICNMIQEMRGRFNPAEGIVIQITKLQAGTNENIIPEECTFGVCIRSHTLENREKIKGGIRKITDTVCDMYGMTYTAKGFQSDFPVVINDPDAVELALASVRKLGLTPVEDSNHNSFGAEDFGYFANASGIPGVFLYSGCATEDPRTRMPLHNGGFLPDPNVAVQNAMILSQVAVDYLSSAE